MNNQLYDLYDAIKIENKLLRQKIELLLSGNCTCEVNKELEKNMVYYFDRTNNHQDDMENTSYLRSDNIY